MKINRMRLSDICNRITSGGTPKTTIAAYYSGGNIPWLNTKEVDFCRIRKTEKYITTDGIINSSAKWIEKNSVVVAMYGATAGKVAIAKIPLTTNQACCNLEINSEIADYSFIYHYLKSKYSIISGLANGGAQQNLNVQIIKDFEIEIPPLNTQKQISSILDACDNKIEINTTINQNLEAQAQAIFKSWFVDFEPFKNGKFVDSELGKIPEGWTIKKLGEVSKNIKEKVASRTNTPVLSAVKEGRLILSEEYFSKQVYSKSLSKYIVVKENEYAYNPARVNIGSLGRNTMCPLGCVSPVYVVFKIDDDYLAFFDLYFKMDSFKKEVKLRASGSVRQTLSYDDFSLIKIIHPPKSVSSEFNKLSMVLFGKITRNNEESRRLSQLRDTLLPKLMSGEIDVSDVAV